MTSSREFRRIVEKNLRKDRRLLERLANETDVDLKDPSSRREPQGKNGSGDIPGKRA